MRSFMLVAAALALCTPCLDAQTSSPTTFVVVRGKDTVSLEQFSRTGNTISGWWIINQGQAQIHEYALELDAAGVPKRYDMAVNFPDGAGHMPLSEAKYVLEFGADSLTLTTGRAKPVTQRLPIERGVFPTVGWSALGQEMLLTRLRAARADSGELAYTQISGGRTSPTQVVSARFVGADSAVVGPIRYKVDQAGHVLGWRIQNGDEARRGTPIDMKRYVAALVTADSVAEAAGRATLITLPVAALDRLVGDYVLNPQVTLTIARDSTKLTMRNGNRPAAELLAHSKTTFSIARAVSAQMIEFETDSTGTATALTILAPGGLKQRVPKAAK